MTAARKSGRRSARANARKDGTEQRAPAVDVAEMKRHTNEASTLLKAMASTPRLLVLCNLVAGEHSVGELLDELPLLGASALSQHLAVLRRQGLVTTRRKAQTIYYALAPGPAVEIISVLHGTFCASHRTRRHTGDV